MINRLEITSASGRVLKLDNFNLQPGKLHFLFGESGIGKSLTAKALYGLLDQTGLRIQIDDNSYDEYLKNHRVKELQQNSFFVFQEPSTHFNPLLRIRTQLHEGLLKDSRYDPLLEVLWPDKALNEVDDLLTIFPQPFRPSGGEKQRILLVMALARLDQWIDRKQRDDPHLFVFDEPTGSLDDRLRNIFMDELVSRHRSVAFTGLIITHDYTLLPYLLSRHPDISAYCEFLEFKKQGGEVNVSKFLPQEFTHWLDQIQSPEQTAAETVLKMEGHAASSSHDLHISTEKSEESPLDLMKGHWAYLKGPSGAGKTTIAKLIMGLAPARYLHLRLAGQTLRETTPSSVWQTSHWGKTVSMVFQHADESLNRDASVKHLFQGLPTLKSSLFDEAMQLMFGTSITAEFWDRPVRYLSGGEKQRLNLIRAVSLGTDVVILDEPFSGMDFTLMSKLLPFLEARRKAGQAFLIISHQEAIFDRLVAPSSIYQVQSAALRTS